jgi:hypothetical protein
MSFLQATQKPLDDSILVGRLASDELLAQPVVAACGAKAPHLKDQPVVAAHYPHRAIRAQRPKPRQTRFREGALSFLRATRKANS